MTWFDLSFTICDRLSLWVWNENTIHPSYTYQKDRKKRKVWEITNMFHQKVHRVTWWEDSEHTSTNLWWEAISFSISFEMECFPLVSLSLFTFVLSIYFLLSFLSIGEIVSWFRSDFRDEKIHLVNNFQPDCILSLSLNGSRFLVENFNNSI